MDISPVYVKMCKKAKEIQETNHSQDGSWYKVYNIDKKKWSIWISLGETPLEFDDSFTSNHTVWLPRQDQLQETIYQDETLLEKLGLFHLWATPYCEYESAHTEKLQKYIEQFTSFEQLWLAFVMKEKFNKVWNGKNWEEELYNKKREPEEIVQYKKEERWHKNQFSHRQE